MKDLHDFARRRAKLLGAYDLVAASDFLPVDELNLEGLRQRRKQLLDERFVLAVCGQMNSGKSTLLNAITFGRPVLPQQVTVTTAKVATLRRGETEGFTASLFDRPEWALLREEAAKIENGQASLERDVEASAAAGYLVAELIQTPGRQMRREGLDSLREFVAVPERGGVVSPFVKLVEVDHVVDWLEAVVVADTPGFNDPNPVRNQVTASWISNADAIVFVTFAGQAMAQADVEFIDTHLVHVPARRRLIAVNKIDTVGDPSQVESFLERLRQKDVRMRSVFGDPGSIVLVCAQAGLIEAMRDAGLPRDGDLAEEEAGYQEDGQLGAEFHGLLRLRALIEKRLLENKGDAVVEAHEMFIDSIFERNLRRVEVELAGIETEEELGGLTRDELARELDAVNGEISKWQDADARLRRDIERTLEDREADLKEALTQWKSALVSEVEKKLRVYETVGQFDGKVVWDFKEAVERRTEGLLSALRQYRKGAEQLLDEARNDALAFLHQGGAGARIRLADTMIDASLNPILARLDDTIEKTLQREAVGTVVREAAGWWGKNLNTDKGRARARDEVGIVLRRLAESLVKKAHGDLVDAVAVSTERGGRAIGEAIAQSLASRRDALNRLSSDLGDLTERLQQIEVRRDTLLDRKAEIQRTREELLHD